MAQAHRLEPEAQDELDAYLRRLEERSPFALTRFVARLDYALALLVTTPVDGPRATLSDGTPARRWLVPPLVVLYRREGDIVAVLRIRHQREKSITKP